MKRQLLVLLVILSTPFLVFSEETLFRDDFDDPKVYNLWVNWEGGTGTVTFRDGYAFLNITEKTKAGDETDVVMSAPPGNLPHRYAGVEVRLRCSDDNRMESDVGGGWRHWGFWDAQGHSALQFSSASPESGTDFAGFHALSAAGGMVRMWEPITGIDITEWHTYTILWEPGNGTFLVDGEVVATTNKVYESNMYVAMGNTNIALRTPYYDGQLNGRIHVPFNTSMQVDYVHIFGIPETVLLPLLSILALFLLPILQRKMV